MKLDGLDLGTVVAVYPEGQSVDVLMVDGSRLANVQVMVNTGSDNTGFVDLPDVGGPIDDSRWSLSATFARHVRAVIAFLRGVPVCIGFLLPQVTQMTFADKNRRIDRHASDVYTSIDGEGNYELHHPSGTYLRVGTSPAHEPLDGRDYDGLWKTGANLQTAPHVHLTVANAGAPVASVDIDPGGNVTVQGNGNLAATVGGQTTLVSAGPVVMTAPNFVFNGAMLINGPLAQGTGAAGGGATMQGPMIVTNDVVAGGISVRGHDHSGVKQGGDISGPPVP